MWTIWMEPGREMARCLSTLCHDSYPRSGQHCACDSKACSRQDTGACWGCWQFSGKPLASYLQGFLSVAGSIVIVSRRESGMLLKAAEMNGWQSRHFGSVRWRQRMQLEAKVLESLLPDSTQNQLSCPTEYKIVDSGVKYEWPASR